MMKMKDLSFILFLIIYVISGMRIRIKNLRKRRNMNVGDVVARRTDRRRKSKLHTRNSCDHKAQLIIVSRTSTDEFQQQQYQDFEDSISLTDQSSNNHIPLDNEYQALSLPSHAPPPPQPPYYDTMNQNSSKVKSYVKLNYNSSRQETTAVW